MKLILSLLLLAGSAGALELGSIGAGQAIAQMLLALVLLGECREKQRKERS